MDPRILLWIVTTCCNCSVCSSAAELVSGFVVVLSRGRIAAAPASVRDDSLQILHTRGGGVTAVVVSTG